MSEKVSVVTGSYSGIGRALCMQLLAQGDDLILLNRDAEKTRAHADELSRQFPAARIWTYLADFAEQTTIRAAAGQIGEAHGHIDALFFVAGILSDQGQLTVDGLEQHFAVNCVAPVLLTQLLRPQLAAAKGGMVVVAGSAARNMVRQLNLAKTARQAGQGGMKAYAESKQALTFAFAALRAEYAKDNIELHVVDIAPTRTDMAKSPALPLLFRLGSFLFVSSDKSAKRLVAAGSGEARPTVTRGLPDAAGQVALLGLIDEAIT